MSCAKVFKNVFDLLHMCGRSLCKCTLGITRGEARDGYWGFCCYSLPYSFEMGSLIESGARLAVDKPQLPRLHPLSTGVTGTHSHTRLHLGARDLNSGPTLAQQTEQWPQPCAKICNEFPQRPLQQTHKLFLIKGFPTSDAILLSSTR